nr:MAG TPA: hypothetical protein [Bacteriophage sp.]
MIICVDFDNTLSLGTRYPYIGKPNTELFSLLNSLRNLDHTSPPTWGRGLKYVSDIKTLKAIVRQAELDDKYHS